MAGRRSKGAHAEEEPENSERWLLTYADMITLLMVLFIVLFAIGQVDQKKFDKLHDGLANSFGQPTVLQGSNGLLEGSAAQAPVPDDAVATSQSIQSQRDAAVQAQQAQAAGGGAPSAGLDGGGPQADPGRVEEAGPGRTPSSSRPRSSAGWWSTSSPTGCCSTWARRRCAPRASRSWTRSRPALKNLPNEMVIEGHTDNLPISDAPLRLQLGAVHATRDDRPAAPADPRARRAQGRRRRVRRPAPARRRTPAPPAGPATGASPSSSCPTPRPRPRRRRARPPPRPRCRRYRSSRWRPRYPQPRP